MQGPLKRPPAPRHWRAWGFALVQGLLPRSCLLCGGSEVRWDTPLCRGCWYDLPRNRESARPAVLPEYVRSVWAPFAYDDPLDELIRAAKFGGERVTARALGRLLVQEGVPHPEQPGILVPVPLHWRRHGIRGFNQAAEMADGAAALLGWSVVANGCRRVRDTAEQSGLSARRRQGNLSGAFVAGAGLKRYGHDRRWIIVDDVLTTGATAAAVAAALHAGGIRSLEFWTLAHPPSHA